MSTIKYNPSKTVDKTNWRKVLLNNTENENNAGIDKDEYSDLSHKQFKKPAKLSK